MLFQKIHFIMSTQFSFICLIDKTLPGATNLGQSGPGSHGNEGVLCIPPKLLYYWTSPSNCFTSYTGHSLEGVLPLCKGAVGVFYSPSRLSKIHVLDILVRSKWPQVTVTTTQFDKYAGNDDEVSENSDFLGEVDEKFRKKYPNI